LSEVTSYILGTQVNLSSNLEYRTNIHMAKKNYTQKQMPINYAITQQ